ncbi:MAG: hypothetical protein HOW73_19280 [Polyangiaceae bacterium]|nr:hypothetical protein [Polyangiaceae bacterium]
MQSIGPGTVHYVGLEPATPGTSGALCLTDGVLEIRWHGAVTERYKVRAGDMLLVEDGASVLAETRLTAAEPRLRRKLFARIPADETAIVHFNEPTVSVLDEITGLETHGFASGDDDVTLELRNDDGVLLQSGRLVRRALLRVAEGDRIEQGRLIAEIPFDSYDRMYGGAEEFADFFKAAPIGRGPHAALAPFAGTVVAIEPKWIVVQDRSERAVRVRIPNCAYVRARAGDDVRPGDVLAGHERSHERLLRVWGEERLAAHLMQELEIELARRRIRVARPFLAMAISAMLGWRRVVEPGDTGVRRHRVISRAAFEKLQEETAGRGGRLATAKPMIRGIRAVRRTQG